MSGSRHRQPYRGVDLTPINNGAGPWREPCPDWDGYEDGHTATCPSLDSPDSGRETTPEPCCYGAAMCVHNPNHPEYGGRRATHDHCWHGQGHPDQSDPACCRCEDNPCGKAGRRTTRPTGEDMGESRHVGRCGQEAPRLVGGPPTFCSLPHGHAGWHKGDNGSEWNEVPEREPLPERYRPRWSERLFCIFGGHYWIGLGTCLHCWKVRDV